MGKKTAPKTTPRTTAINPASIATVSTLFSPCDSTASSSLYYAHLHCAPDAHTLRVYEVESGRCVSRWASNAAGGEASEGQDDDEPRVKSMAWAWIPSQANGATGAAGEGGDTGAGHDSKRGKKRRKSDGGSAAVDSPAKPTAGGRAGSEPKLVVVLGLETGAVLVWDPRGTAPLKTLSHPTSTSPVTALALPVQSERNGHVWTGHDDGAVRVWDLVAGNLVGKVAGLSEEKRWDDLLVRYEAGNDEAKLVVSHLSLHVYSVQVGAAAAAKKEKVRDLRATEIGRCTGHVEPASIRWTGASSAPASTVDRLTFLSYTASDRFVQIWSIPSTSSDSSANGTLLARLALDSGVSSATVSPLASDSQTLAAIDTQSGSVSLASLPAAFPTIAPSPAKKGKKTPRSTVVALEAVCEVVPPTSGSKGESGAAQLAFRADEGKLVVCRGGVKPVFEVVSYKEEDGSYIKKVDLTRSVNGSLLVGSAAEPSSSAPQPTRYSEHSAATVAANSAAPDAVADSDEEEAVNAGELDVDMAEPTLADRLKALNVTQKKERRKAALAAKKAAVGDDDVEVASESSGSEEIDSDEDDEEDDDEEGVGRVPATTLTTTLVQALHSSDAPLLESCLTHSSPTLVRSTVKRLPSGSLVLSLLEALVERLGKQKRGKEGMASVKRARALVAWLRETLIVHVGFLVTIPSLVSRLATLHASLSQRLALQPALLALNGRLELVMSQIDMRQDRPASSTSGPSSASNKGKQGVKARRYVEGESEDEDDEGDEGEVEDVVLGPGGDDDEFDDEDDGDEDEDVDSAFEDEEDGAGSAKPRRKVNGVSSLLDLEASEDDDFDEDEVDEGAFEGIDDDDSDEDGEGDESD
ncbi:hypothetical protein JCM10212_004965 [Sporobolomyces blumeae]